VTATGQQHASRLPQPRGSPARKRPRASSTPDVSVPVVRRAMYLQKRIVCAATRHRSRARAPPCCVCNACARLRSNPIRLLHSPPLLSPPRAPQGTHPAPFPARAAPAPPLRISASTGAPSAPPPCATTSANLPPRHSAPTTPRGLPASSPRRGRLRAGAAPCCAEPAGTTPLHVSAPQADLTRAPPVLLQRRAD